MEIIVFPVKQADIYPTETRHGYVYFPSDFSDKTFATAIHDWNSNDITVLNNTFKNQVVQNMRMSEYYDFNCKMIDPDNYYECNKLYLEQNLQIEDAINKCKKYASVYKGIIDTLERDSNMFMQQGKKPDDPPINAVVILDDAGVYTGHIYTWVTGPNCYAFGIRGRVDKIFNDSKIPVSAFLFEGVRRFAIENSCIKIRVPNPLKVMKTILQESYDFTIIPGVPVYEIKNDYAGYTYNKSAIVYEKHISSSFIEGVKIYTRVNESE
jgi:hypothetical protein